MIGITSNERTEFSRLKSKKPSRQYKAREGARSMVCRRWCLGGLGLSLRRFQSSTFRGRLSISHRARGVKRIASHSVATGQYRPPGPSPPQTGPPGAVCWSFVKGMLPERCGDVIEWGSGRGDPVPLDAFTAHDVLETRVVAGLDKNKIAILRAISTTEGARKTRIGRDMGHHDPGTPAGG